MSADPDFADDYPPARHVSRDLGIACRFTSAQTAEARVPVTPAVVGADGAVRSEVLLSVFDEVAGFLAVFSVLPDWIATADFQFGVAPVPAGDEVELKAEIIKAGKRLVVVECEAWTDGRRTAWAAAGFSRVPRSGANAQIDMPESDPSVVYDLALADSGFDRPFPEALGIATLDAEAGSLEVTFGPYLRNTAGLLHGGVGGGLGLLAAEAASGGSTRWRAIDAHFHYLSPGRVGPFRTSAGRLGGHATRQVWLVEVVDGVDDDRPLTAATVSTAPAVPEEDEHG
jgi:acyl-coenzyme A thioesterase PaaI-like protein